MISNNSILILTIPFNKSANAGREFNGIFLHQFFLRNWIYTFPSTARAHKNN
jgi:hypothetical protein